jgi:phosphoglycerate dehydrogenase-like enzyme
MNVLIYTREHDPNEFKGYLTEEFPDVKFFPTRDEAEAASLIDKAEVLLTLKFSDTLLANAKDLKWVHTIITGTNYIEELPSFQARKDLILTSTRGIHGPQMSELAILLMIALNRKFPGFVRNQDKRVWQRWPTELLYEKKVAILGIGVIGEAIAKRCKAFEMTVIGLDPVQRKVDALDHFYGMDRLHEVLSEVDYVVDVAPSTPENQKMINAAAFAKMKPTAFFINIGRGETVDEDALLKALKERKIAGAGLDVFWQEPLPPDHPFWGLDNLILTPHVGGMAAIYVKQAVAVFRENLRRYLKGERRNLVNFIERK